MSSGDTSWVLAATALVLFMTLPGLALFYGGLVRSKSVLSVVMHCFSITALASLLWMVLGYSLAFGDDVGGVLGGVEKAFFAGIGKDTLRGSIPEIVFAIFQMTFAVITPALIVGGICRAYQVSRHNNHEQCVGASGVRADLSLGVGWRLAPATRGNGLCGRVGGTRQRRNISSGHCQHGG